MVNEKIYLLYKYNNTHNSGSANKKYLQNVGVLITQHLVSRGGLKFRNKCYF